MGIMPKRNHLLSLSTTLAAIVALVVLFAGCGTTATPSVVKVTIVGGNVSMDVGATKTLTADVSVLGGAAKTVTWKSDSTTIASVNSSNGTVTAKAVGKAKITATSTVDKTKSSTITVSVQPASPPTVNSFTASPASIDEGATTTLSWDVSGASTYSLSDGTTSINIPQTPTGNVTVLPTAPGTVTYTLTANNVKGNTTATATVTVQAAAAVPVVNSFAASPTTVTEGSSTASTLSWDTSGAVGWTLSDGTNPIDIPQSATGSVDVTPTATTTYTLTATNSQGDTTATATVTVQPAATAPTINSFTANPTSIAQGDTTTLSWDVSGATSLSMSDGTNPITIAQTATGTVDVTPTQTGTVTYTLTATNSQGSVTATADVTVSAVTGPTITNLQATIAMGSTVDLSWQQTGATTFDIYAVLNTDSTDQQLIQSGVTGTTATIAIPASTRQTVRVVATGPGGSATADVTLTNVVTSNADYDPYMLQGHTPDSPVPGTLRYEIANAASGSIVGFASNVTAIDISGVDILSSSGADSHLIFRGDVTVSAPAAGVTLNGVSPAPSGTPAAEVYTWESRMMLVAPGVTVHLDHLTIQGGTFIYNGAGIFNQGTLTLSNSTVTGNRAWQLGGGIYNASGATLNLTDSHVDANQAITLDGEMGTILRYPQRPRVHHHAVRRRLRRRPVQRRRHRHRQQHDLRRQ